MQPFACVDGDGAPWPLNRSWLGTICWSAQMGKNGPISLACRPYGLITDPHASVVTIATKRRVASRSSLRHCRLPQRICHSGI
jgi:hypothetical protein